ncbi:unnamed protein product [Cyprideis torosa]|uniref:ADP-ribosylation factor-like protein 6-interacting protein 4 n=1 Tax=Cyprideis torosa TaxID=163714 RepID=A0A7R8W019_9CRUS|nr:unnamed protein product [Cyprideis torosa]CAG0879279.1 unnamed protein product [Cyprideis torosa]
MIPSSILDKLIKGDGEVLEEIVSRDQHLAINRRATQGDGEHFQASLLRKAASWRLKLWQSGCHLLLPSRMPVTRGSENQIVTLSFRKKLVFGLLLLIGFGIYLGLAFLLSIRHLLRPSWLSNRASSFQDRRSDVLELHRDYVLDNAPDHLFVFMQIADTHISAYRDTTRDLTDARTENYIGSGQILEEWQGWLHLIEELHLQERTVWLDIRGNHDTFNMPKAAENLYHKRHTLLGRQGVNRSTIQIIVKGPDSYAFIGIDATIVPGLKRIYNYIGSNGIMR